MGDKIENGKVEVMGINVDISQILGEKIIDQYIAKLSDSDIETLMDYISKDLFTKDIFNQKTIIKCREKDQWGQYRDNEIPIGELMKNKFNERIKEELSKKVDEIISSTDYQMKIDEIANELVEYSITGYKEDLKKRVKERLVDNVIDPSVHYNYVPLQVIINEEINKRLHR